MVNLLHEIEALKAQQRAIRAEAEQKCKALEEAEKVLRIQNEACWYCKGTGKILRSRSCAEDDRPDPLDPRDYTTCAACNGTGHKKWTDGDGKEHWS